jgi:hypothetical protein
MCCYDAICRWFPISSSMVCMEDAAFRALPQWPVFIPPLKG